MPYPKLTADEMSRAHRDELYQWCRQFMKDNEALKLQHGELLGHIEEMSNGEQALIDSGSVKDRHHK